MRKILICGDSGSGKTSLLVRLKENRFVKEFNSSRNIGIFNFENTTYLDFPKSCKLSVCDVLDLEKIFIVADKSSKISVENAFKYWLPLCKKKFPNVKISILLNKDDVQDDTQQFSDLLYELNRDEIKVLKISVKNGKPILS
jgi:GTPase SAR1 family protein